MTVEITTPRSRRAILAAALGAGAATVATALGRPLAVRATEGEPVHVGNTYSASHQTGFDTTGGWGQTAPGAGNEALHPLPRTMPAERRRNDPG